MQKKILIAVDGSDHADNALRYAAGFVSSGIDLQLALMHMQPMIPPHIGAGTKSRPEIEGALQRLVDEYNANSQSLLEKGKELLVREGVAPTSIELVSQIRKSGMARDIIEYGISHQFDAIVAGRRGLTRLQKMFMGSTSSKIVEHSGHMPVWIVDGNVRPHNVLIAVDIEPGASTLVDHACRMFAGMKEIRLTFYHVVEKLRMRLKLAENPPFTPGFELVEELAEQSEKSAREDFWEETTQKLAAAGFKDNHFNIKMPRRTTKTGKMIIEEAEKNDHDTVIIGRTGSDKAFYFGNVARYVSERLSDRALWVVG